MFNSVRGLPRRRSSAVPAGSLGVLFDQEYGIMAYAPVLLLAFVGLPVCCALERIDGSRSY